MAKQLHLDESLNGAITLSYGVTKPRGMINHNIVWILL